MRNSELIDDLKLQLPAAIKSNYIDLTSEYGDICGYAICTTPYIESIIPAYQRESELQACDAKRLSLAIHFPPEWNSFGTLEFGDDIQALSTKLSHRRFGIDDGEELDADTVFDAILEVFAGLERDGVFGKRSPNRFLTMWSIGNDEHWILKASKELNSDDVHATACQAFGRNP
ncbi:DUF4303 domain-containing protein [Stieleria sp. JC731]|uniref:DUF4303 domain-containing protein n=1 Tax=Pirellulaceae TaxID=2691357 RepID=UPI001E352C87|nr:DUF4303 domain-containing protein [Stieleria sp. JC731]MCC9602253.1 DUF4303 domain-containing protein [Stieleria sp. JC731]